MVSSIDRGEAHDARTGAGCDRGQDQSIMAPFMLYMLFLRALGDSYGK